MEIGRIRGLKSALIFTLLMLAVCVWGVPAQADTHSRDVERVWTTREGAEITAKFSGIASEQALLKRSGKVERVPLDTLSEADIDWIRELLTQEGTPDRLPKKYREAANSSEPTSAEDENPFATANPGEADDPAEPPEGGSTDDENPFESNAASAQGEADTPEDSAEPVGEDNPFEDSKNENPDDTVREWTDKNGKTITGSLQSVEGEQAVIQTDKRIIRVPLAGFSQKDLEWIVGDYRKRGRLSQLPKKFHSINRPFVKKGVAKLNESRLWTDLQGRTTDAKFMSVGVSGDEIQLLGTRFFTVKLSLITREDLIWLQSALREEGRLTELPLPYRDPIDPSLSGAELSKYRKTKFYRKWNLINRESATAQWQHLEKGEVHLTLYDTGETVKVPYENLTKADKAYVRERLEYEMPGELFPVTSVTETTPEQAASGFRVWTDLDGNRVSGKLVRTDKSSSVHILETSEGEKAYIAAFFSNEDGETIDGVNKAKNSVVNNTTSTMTFNNQSTGGSRGMSSRASATQNPAEQSRLRHMDAINRQNAVNQRFNQQLQASNQQIADASKQVADANQRMKTMIQNSGGPTHGGAFRPTVPLPAPTSVPMVNGGTLSGGPGNSGYANGAKAGQVIGILLPLLLIVAYFVVYRSR